MFVNSYQVLAEFSKYLPDVLYKDSRNATTELVLESQKDALKVFQENVKDKKRKSILVAVQRGKLSEGIDFSDNLCRVVFIVSIPFANKNDVYLQRIIRFLNAKKPGLGQ